MLQLCFRWRFVGFWIGRHDELWELAYWVSMTSSGQLECSLMGSLAGRAQLMGVFLLE